MQRDHTSTIRQLNQARQNCLDAIAATEKASANDGVDRSGSVGSMRRDLASYERQLAELGAPVKQAEVPMPVAIIAEEVQSEPAETDSETPTE